MRCACRSKRQRDSDSTKPPAAKRVKEEVIELDSSSDDADLLRPVFSRREPKSNQQEWEDYDPAHWEADNAVATTSTVTRDQVAFGDAGSETDGEDQMASDGTDDEMDEVKSAVVDQPRLLNLGEFISSW